MSGKGTTGDAGNAWPISNSTTAQMRVLRDHRTSALGFRHRPPLPDKIINQIATMVATHTRDNSFPMFETAPQISYSNKGKIFIFNAGSIVPIATIGFDFQDDVYTLAINWRGSDIPSQAPRKEYFDFRQSYDKHSAFWSVLQKLLTTDKA